jgi:hypothetical protein
MNTLAAELLPTPIAEFLGDEGRKQLVARSHAPDDFTPWPDYAEKRGVTIADADAEFLAQHGIKHPYGLHAPRGQAVNVLLVARNMRDRGPQRAGFWMACLLHTMCDEAACNHDPLIHVMTYAYRSGYGLSFPEKGFLDVGELCRTEEGRGLVRQAIDQLPRETVGADRLLLDTMLHGYHANAFMTARGTRIARAFSKDVAPEEREDAHRALAELGAYGVVSALRTFDAAWKAARNDTIPKLDDNVIKQFDREKAAYLAARPLESDSLYAEMMPFASPKPGAVGIMVEPCRSMDDRSLSWGGKVLAPAVARALRDRDVPFRFVDLRDLSHASPTPEDLPILIVFTGRFGAPQAVRNLKTYREKGGRLLIVGGEHRGVLGDLSSALEKADPELLPVSLKYGRNNEEVIGDIRVVFTGPFADRLGTEPYRFVHNPDTKAGWQKPACPYRLAENPPPDVKPLVALTVRDRSFATGAMMQAPDGSAAAIFLPEYVLAQYLLIDDPPMTDPSRPTLDAVGTKVLASALDLLRPPRP